VIREKNSTVMQLFPEALAIKHNLSYEFEFYNKAFQELFSLVAPVETHKKLKS
jgi:hypothetical protein